MDSSVDTIPAEYMPFTDSNNIKLVHNSTCPFVTVLAVELEVPIHPSHVSTDNDPKHIPIPKSSPPRLMFVQMATAKVAEDVLPFTDGEEHS